MTKQIVLIQPDGFETQLMMASGRVLPDLSLMQELVGGYIEIVRVLRTDLLPAIEHTALVINEEGRLHDLERNERATDLYLAEVRRAFPDSDNPGQEAFESRKRQWERAGMSMIDARVDADDPYIAGPAIWFDGWTMGELEDAGF